jgi:branched-subunit amino acid transport protein
MESTDYLLLLLGMGLVTYIPRWIPLFFLTRRSLPPLIIKWLDLIPAAILSALLLPALVTTGEPLHFTLYLPQLWVAVPTLIFALWTRSLGGTVLGMFLFDGMFLYLDWQIAILYSDGNGDLAIFLNPAPYG